MPVDSAARPRMSPAVVVMMLTLLLCIQPVTTDLYLSALPTGVAAAQAPLVTCGHPTVYNLFSPHEGARVHSSV